MTRAPTTTMLLAGLLALSLFAAVPAGASVAEDQETDDETQCYSITTPTGGQHSGCLQPGNCGGGGQEGGIIYYYQCSL